MSVEPGYRRFGALVWAALAITTLLNTTTGVWSEWFGLSGLEAGELRDRILIGHAVLGLLASWSLALALFPAAPGATGAGFLFAFIEKSTELVGQVLIVFTLHNAWRPALDAATDAATRQSLQTRIAKFLDIWDDTFLVFLHRVVAVAARAGDHRYDSHQSRRRRLMPANHFTSG